MEKEIFNLRGLPYKLIETVTSEDDRNRVFKCNNNLILFVPFDEEVEDIFSICNSIRNEAYFYLINKLSESNNMLIVWSQVGGTTSDYTIYYDEPFNELENLTLEELVKHIDNIEYEGDEVFSYKYTEVINNTCYKIEF